MPNLVGIGNSQVPTNAMLGGLAYQDSVGEINIDKIKARITGTAVDVFVYDTSKDSDGGAWRKKATKQSWYDEGVSQRRGARKEFPVIAVIVVQSSYVTIYDGDDPNLPLWMEFTVNNSPGQIIFTNPTVAHMLNGVLVVGTNPNATNNDYWDGGIKVFNFISDTVRSYSGTRSMIYDMNISQRNDPKVIRYDTTNVLVSPNVSAVTMFLLPDATIDVDTGLPIPTIIAATRRGISVVKESGTVFDMLVSVGGGSNYQTNSIEITKDLKIIHNWDDRASNAYSFISIIPLSLFESDSSYGYEYQFRNEGTYGYNVGGNSLDIFDAIATYFVDAVPTELGYFAIGSSKGLVNIQHIPQALNNGGRSSLGDARFSGGMHCRITNNFNTGWMYDNIKGAFLSDTSTTNITGSELLANPGPSFSNTNNWYLDASNQTSGTIATLTVSSGRLVFTHSDTNSYWDGFGASFTCTVGEVYVVKFDIHSVTSMNLLRISNTASQHDDDIQVAGSNVAGVHAHTFTATATTMYLHWNAYTTAGTMQLNSVSVRIGEEDRSVRNQGLQVFGTVSRAKVATGADLVYYGGFSNSNYLLQPYNSDLDFGTGDLCIMFWAKFTQNNTYDDLIHRRAHNGSAYTGNGWYLQMGANNNIVLKDNLGGSRAVMDGDSTYGVWQHFCFVRRNNIGYSYKNGIQGSTTTPAWTENLDNSSAILTIGRGTISGSGDADKTFLALVRISAGAPSEEQIKKIYNDEKCLFHENAKCTLHGTSDDIKAIDYDESNNVTHVGTSAGRSEFRGLNRINNTTTAVTTAISVSNGFVAEQ